MTSSRSWRKHSQTYTRRAKPKNMWLRTGVHKLRALTPLKSGTDAEQTSHRVDAAPNRRSCRAIREDLDKGMAEQVALESRVRRHRGNKWLWTTGA